MLCLKFRTLLCALVLAAAYVSRSADAYSSFQSRIPNGGAVTRGGEAWPGVGHTSSAGGGALNPFGTAWRAVTNWTRALCEADSDGDGFTNGQELGDPDCIWFSGQTAARTTDISHPGFADSVPSSLTAPPNASTTTTAVTTTLAPVEPPGLVFEAQTTASDGAALAAVLRQHVIGALDANVAISSFSGTSGSVEFHFTGTDRRIADQSLLGRPAELRRSQLLLVDLKIVISTTAAPPTTSAPADGNATNYDDDENSLSSFAVAAIVLLLLAVLSCLVGVCVVRHRRASSPKLSRAVHRQHKLVFPELADSHDDHGDDHGVGHIADQHDDDFAVLSPYRPLVPNHDQQQFNSVEAGDHGTAPPVQHHSGPHGHRESPRGVSTLPKIRRVQVHGSSTRNGAASDHLLERDGFRPSTHAPRADVNDL